jgi:hypothetical protein
MHLFFLEKDIGINFKLPVSKGNSILFIPHLVGSDQFEKAWMKMNQDWK